MVEAHEKHVETHAAAKPEERTALPDKRTAILKEMDVMAVAHLATPVGATMALGSFSWSWNLDLDLPNLNVRFRRLTEHYPDEPELNDLLGQVPEAAMATKGFESWTKSLRDLSTHSTKKETRVSALLTLGQLQLRLDHASEAEKTFTSALALKPKDELKEIVEGWIHETRNLQIGMQAPAFSTRSLDDKNVSLESLRGKVVLLNFWASW